MKTVLNKCLSILGDVFGSSVVGLEHRSENICLSFALVGCLTREENVRQNAERPDVNSWSVVLACQYFRRHVKRTAKYLLLIQTLVVGSEAKIGYFCTAVFCQQNILRLYVSVNDALLVHVVKCE